MYWIGIHRKVLLRSFCQGMKYDLASLETVKMDRQVQTRRSKTNIDIPSMSRIFPLLRFNATSCKMSKLVGSLHRLNIYRIVRFHLVDSSFSARANAANLRQSLTNEISSRLKSRQSKCFNARLEHNKLEVIASYLTY